MPGWTTFVFACNSNATNATAAQGQADTTALLQRFDLARQRLDVLAGL